MMLFQVLVTTISLLNLFLLLTVHCIFWREKRILSPFERLDVPFLAKSLGGRVESHQPYSQQPRSGESERAPFLSSSSSAAHLQACTTCTRAGGEREREGPSPTLVGGGSICHGGGGKGGERGRGRTEVVAFASPSL